MLSVAEETLVRARAGQDGDRQESAVPPETASAPQGLALRFGRRLDRLVTRGRLTEQQSMQLLQAVRRDSQPRNEPFKDQTLEASRPPLAPDVGNQHTVLPPSMRSEPLAPRERCLVSSDMMLELLLETVTGRRPDRAAWG